MKTATEEIPTHCQFTGKRLLRGEIFAMTFTGCEPATEEEMEKHLAYARLLEARRENNDGVIGISKVTHSNAQWVLHIQELPKAVLTFRNPLGACEFFNRFKRAKYGEHAVLCDPMGVVRKWLLK